MSEGIQKSLTGISGFDELTLGGLPTGRPTLVCGSAGCGKTLFASTFLVHGARDFGEPGVFISFEERPVDIVQNVASLGFDLDDLIDEGKIAIDHIMVDPSELAEIGEYDLEGLFLRLELAIDSVGAKRVVLDTIESLFSAFSNPAILRAEIRRLFDWLKDRGLTTVITAERGDGTLTRQGLEEYVSDCVLLLDHRVHNQISTRRLRIVKYRGTAHGTNEYPFLIDEDGFSVLPVSAIGLAHKVYEERISTGVPDLDSMMTGGGFHRGSSVLLSGVAGSGKSSLAASFVAAACGRGEKAVYFSFEESADQTVRNMRSIGVDLQPWIESGLLRHFAARPTFYSLEMHLAVMLREIIRLEPKLVVLDPISAFTDTGDKLEVQSMLLRIIDFLKGKRDHRRLHPPDGGRRDDDSDRRRSVVADGCLDSAAQSRGERRIQPRALPAEGARHGAFQPGSRIRAGLRRHQADPAISRRGGSADGLGAQGGGSGDAPRRNRPQGGCRQGAPSDRAPATAGRAPRWRRCRPSSTPRNWNWKRCCRTRPKRLPRQRATGRNWLESRRA